MLDEYKTPDIFWTEAINTACHAINRLYLHKYLGKTPYEIIIGNKTKVHYFRVFGSKCFILNKKTKSSKFASKVDKGFILGYDTNEHAYRVVSKTTSDPTSELPTIHLNLYIPVGQLPQTLTHSHTPLTPPPLSSQTLAGKSSFNNGISLLWGSLDSPIFGTFDPHHLFLHSHGKSSRYFIKSPHRPISQCRKS
jgi:hypothetical protein